MKTGCQKEMGLKTKGGSGLRNLMMKRIRIGHYSGNHKDTLHRSSDYSATHSQSSTSLPGSVSGPIAHDREQVAALLMATVEAEHEERVRAQEKALELERKLAREENMQQNLERKRREAKESAAAKIRAMVESEQDHVSVDESRQKDTNEVTGKDKDSGRADVRAAAAAKIRAMLDADDDAPHDASASTVLPSKPSGACSSSSLTNHSSEASSAMEGLPKQDLEGGRAAAAARIRAMLQTDDSEDDGEGARPSIPPTGALEAGNAAIALEACEEHKADTEGAGRRLDKTALPKKLLEDPKRKAAVDEIEKRRMQRERRQKQGAVVVDGLADTSKRKNCRTITLDDCVELDD